MLPKVFKKTTELDTYVNETEKNVQNPLVTFKIFK